MAIKKKKNPAGPSRTANPAQSPPEPAPAAVPVPALPLPEAAASGGVPALLQKLANHLRAMPPGRIVALVPLSVSLAATAIALTVLLQMWMHTAHPAAAWLLTWSVRVVLVAAPLAWAFRHPVDPRGAKAYLLACQLGALLLFVPVFLSGSTADGHVQWLTWGFLNKRWLFASYWLGVATLLVFPHLIFRLLEDPARLLDLHYAAETPSAGGKPRPAAISLLLITGKIVLALGLAWYFAGPPWHLERHHQAVDIHEQFNLGPLQAIDKGYTPYLGPAFTQYGPGAQLLTYTYMKWRHTFNLVTYRESYTLFHFLTFFIFCLIGCLLLEVWLIPPLVALGLAYSPLTFFSWTFDGTLGGFYGWANGLRYAGVLVVVTSLPALLRSRASLRMPGWRAFALGVVWGFFAWVAQENLSSTVAAGGLLLALLWLTETVSLHVIGRVTLNLAAGFAAFWIPVLGYYAGHGALSEFLGSYLLVPGTVLLGFQNTFWTSGDAHPHLNAFYFTGPFLILVGACTLCDIRGLHLRRRLDSRQVRLLACVCGLAACYPASLFRSDSSHLTNTMICLPFVVVLALRDLPGWIATSIPARWSVRVFLAGLAIYIFPVWPMISNLYRAGLLPPSWRYTTVVHSKAAVVDNRIPFQRATPALADSETSGVSVIRMRPFLEDASALRDMIGTRKTHIVSYPGLRAGFLYFMLDLTPAPYLGDRDMVLINTAIRDRALKYFENHARECDALIAEARGSADEGIFMRAHPDATVTSRTVGGMPYYVLLAGR